MNAFFQDVLERLAWSLPYFGVQAYGLWICSKYREGNFELSKWSRYAFGLFILNTIFSILNHAWFATLTLPQSSKGMLQFGGIYAFTTGLSAVLNLVAWLLLLRGIHRTLQPNHGRPGV